eukprot:3937585-Lingulodinium_polyedra.AAC.1
MRELQGSTNYRAPRCATVGSPLYNSPPSESHAPHNPHNYLHTTANIAKPQLARALLQMLPWKETHTSNN